MSSVNLLIEKRVETLRDLASAKIFITILHDKLPNEPKRWPYPNDITAIEIRETIDDLPLSPMVRNRLQPKYRAMYRFIRSIGLASQHFLQAITTELQQMNSQIGKTEKSTQTDLVNQCACRARPPEPENYHRMFKFRAETDDETCFDLKESWYAFYTNVDKCCLCKDNSDVDVYARNMTYAFLNGDIAAFYVLSSRCSKLYFYDKAYLNQQSMSRICTAIQNYPRHLAMAISNQDDVMQTRVINHYRLFVLNTAELLNCFNWDCVLGVERVFRDFDVADATRDVFTTYPLESLLKNRNYDVFAALWRQAKKVGISVNVLALQAGTGYAMRNELQELIEQIDVVDREFCMEFAEDIKEYFRVGITYESMALRYADSE